MTVKRMHWLIGWLLLLLLLGMAAAAAEGTAQPISVGESVIVNIEQPMDTALFSFVPSETGVYA